MTKVVILSANLGKFDADVPNVPQIVPPDVEVTEFRWNDENFPPIAGLTPRMQYRIPKLFGWDMFPGYDIYLWLDGSMQLTDPHALEQYLKMIDNTEFVIYKHPWRHSIREEVEFIEKKLAEGNEYITNRYKNGLHRENLTLIEKNKDYVDDTLYASTVFMYRDIPRIRHFMRDWWFYQSRYFSCDQVPLPYLLSKHEVAVYRINENVFKNDYVRVTGRHKS